MDYIELGKRIRAARSRLNLTQEQLAEQAELSAAFVGHIERGTRVLSVETLVRLCRVLQITPNALLSFSVFEDLSAGQAELMEQLIACARALAASVHTDLSC